MAAASSAKSAALCSSVSLIVARYTGNNATK
jgi:hypothetical protein